MELSITVTIAIFIVGFPLYLFTGNLFQNYQNKIIKIRQTLLGCLESARIELCREIEGSRIEESQYKIFIERMRNSHFLKYANEYEDMIYFETTLERDINYFGWSVLLFIIPLIVLNSDTGIAAALVYFITIPFVSFLSGIIRKIRRINKLYKQYVIGRESFGGYS